MTVRTVTNAVGFCVKRENGDIEVESYARLAEFDDPFLKVIEGYRQRPTELYDSVEFGSLFFYTISQFKVDHDNFANVPFTSERGIARLSSGPPYLLTREFVHSLHERTSTGNFVQTRGLGATPFDFTNNDYFVITAHAPNSYLDALSYEHSVLCSIEPSTPTPVHLENNTLLGRIGGRIQSVDRGELFDLLGVKLVNHDGLMVLTVEDAP